MFLVFKAEHSFLFIISYISFWLLLLIMFQSMCFVGSEFLFLHLKGHKTLMDGVQHVNSKSKRSKAFLSKKRNRHSNLTFFLYPL